MSGTIPKERDPSAHVPRLVEPGDSPAIDTLPPDAPEPRYDLLCQFLAYIRASRINVGGELEITLGIPFEFKYDAMPMTDLRGLNFHVVIYRPVEPSHTSGNNG